MRDWLALRASPIFSGHGAARGDGAPVVVVPGFLGSDGYLFELRGWLARIGYRPYRSLVGWNAQCPELVVGRLRATVDRAHAETGRRVHLIGHSLGGVLSRILATRHPERVASVVTLASPFRGIRSHPLILRAAAAVRARMHRQGRPPNCFTAVCGCDSVRAMEAPLTVAQIAIYTKTDGIVDWRVCVGDDPVTDREVSGTHVGLVWNAAVYRLIAAHLAAATPAPPQVLA